MSVSSDSRPPEAVEFGELPITNDNDTTAVSPSSTQYESAKAHGPNMSDTVPAQETKVADSVDAVSLSAKVRTICSS